MYEVLAAKALALNEDLRDYKIEHYESSKKGEGLAGIVTRVIFTGRDFQNKIIKKKLVLKVAPTHEVYRSSTPIHDIYRNEVYVYEKVLPMLETVSKSFDVDFVRHPKYHLSSLAREEEYLVLDDLKSCGYNMWDNKKVMNDQHIHLVLNNLAKFHAPSFYLKIHRPELWKDLTNNLVNVAKYFFGDTMFCDSAIEMAKPLDYLFKDQEEILRKFAKFRDEELKYFMVEFCSRNNSDFVVVHGDMWSNNLLFEYNDKINPSKPTDVAFLDFQAVRLSSIALDLSYFLYVCITKESMSSIDAYLSYYYNQLCENMKKMALNPQEVFPYSAFQSQWRQYNKFGLTMAIGVLHAVSRDSDEFPSFEDVARSGKNYWLALNFKSKHQDRYHERIKDVISHFANKNYL